MPTNTISDSPVWEFLDNCGAGGLQQRADQVRQLVRDHGVTFSAPGDLQAGDRTWQLDLIPVVLGSEEFQKLSQGLAQRARLINAVLVDCYGPQTLVKQGHLPAELVLGNPLFLRSCNGIGLGRMLHLYAADIARTPSGEWCLLRDRTQAPTGAGYALENRLVLARVLEEPFRQANVLRLASFFHSLRESFIALSPLTRDHPRIVVLSAGAWSPTYFEQAFLAQYLGYPLVEGGDLTVRDRRVFLKTLGGLSPVDVIFRHPEDDFCDPLELRTESSLGVPGLVEAIRAGHVAVANALGTGLVQSPAFLPFLPRLGPILLGEELLLPSVPAFWCGNPSSLSHVVAHWDSMVIRAAWPGVLPSIIFGNEIHGSDRENLLALLFSHPERYVAQERVTLRSAMVFAGGELLPRPFVVRGYAVFNQGSYRVMPGGLSLAAPDHGDPNIAMNRGAQAKDIWVQHHGPVGDFSLMPPVAQSVELSRGGADLPSRSADNLFWLGRYVERSEAIARLARHLLGLLAEEGEVPHRASPVLPILLDVIANSTEGPPLTSQDPVTWLAHALCSPSPPSSLSNTLRSAIRSAVAVRDRLSSDTFRVLGSLGKEVDRSLQAETIQTFGSLAAYLDRIVTGVSAFSGLSMESMTRGHGWRFLDIGRRLERALQLVSLLRTVFASGSEKESALLETLLEVADSRITYRRRYLAGLHPAAVVDLLLVDDGNPRAVLFQIMALREHLMHLPHDPAQARLRPEERLILGAQTRLQLLDVVPACQPPTGESQPPLHRLLIDLEDDLSLLSDHLSGSYLSHALVPRLLALGDAKGKTT